MSDGATVHETVAQLIEEQAADRDEEALEEMAEWGTESDPTIPEVPLPTIDDTDRVIASRTMVYPDWKPEDTFIASGPLPHGAGPGTPMESMELAAEHVLRLHGKIIERIRGAEKGGRWAFRVPRRKT